MSKTCVTKVVALLAVLAWAAPSFACPVCFGESDSPMIGAMNLSILFMLAVTYVLIVGGLVSVFVLRARARKRTLAAATVPAAHSTAR